MDRLEIALTEFETKLLLKALIFRERGLARLRAASEAEAANAGKDLVQLRQLLTELRDGAVARFGVRVLDLDGTPP